MTLRSASITASIALAALLAASAASAQPASPPVTIVPRMMLGPSQEARLQAADQGIDALRQYVWRTRSIYNYYLPELLR